ncbi:biogenesis of lysosome-related organelles complex 1 subunit 6 [Dermacentor albipictus]|uniref:biogenesis of lysosome-related organelles complex 1 subunit 6 n=1 Tax=Dermacentor albipictus TaxID=60249 RepID=UPI0031FD2121
MATTTMEQLGHVDDLRALQASLGDLTRNQGLLLDTVQQENNRFADALGSLDDVLQRARVYQAKLVRLKRDMTELQQRSSRLRKRALRLQQLKQKEALQAEQQRQRDLERTRQLQPRVAPQLATP